MHGRVTASRTVMIQVEPVSPEHWPEVRRIYLEGIASGHATFETEASALLGKAAVDGSPAGSLRELREALEFAAEYKLRPTIREFPLEQVDEAFAEIPVGNIAGRAVLRIAEA